MYKVSVVIPVYRGEFTIIPLVEKISNALDPGYLWEAILVFDHGLDKSWERIKDACILYPGNVSGYRLGRNYGQQRTLMAGISKASGDFVVTMDEDLQHDPAMLPAMLDTIISEGYDVLYGKFDRLEQNIPRKLFSRLLRRILITFLPHLYHNYSPYRIIRSDTILKIKDMNGTITFIDDYLSRTTSNCGYARVGHKKRPSGKSSYSVSGLFGLAISAILAYSYIVQVLIISGTIIAAASLFNREIPGKPGMLTIVGGLLAVAGLAGLAINMANRRSNLRVIEISDSVK